VRRHITQVFTKGTCNLVDLQTASECGVNSTAGPENEIPEEPERSSSDRNILFFIRCSGEYREMATKKEQSPLFKDDSACDSALSPAKGRTVSCQTDLGFVFFDISILKMYSGVIKSGSSSLVGSRSNADRALQLQQFNTLLLQVKPIEIVTLYAEKSLPTLALLKNLPSQPQLSFLTQETIYNFDITKNYIEQQFRTVLDGELPSFLEGDHRWSKPEVLAFGLATRYLEKMMLSEATLPFV
jgi:hypothetical protein